MRRLLTGLLGASLLLGACGGNDDDDRSLVTSIPEQTTTSTTTTTPPVPPPDVIPDDPALITEEYVEQVLNLLFEVSNETLLATMDAGLVTAEVIDLIDATSPDSRAADDVNELIRLSAQDFPGIRPRPDPLVASVDQVLEASSACIFAEVTLDDSGVLETPTNFQGTRTFARLLPATQQQAATGLNPTAWVLDDLPADLERGVPNRRC
jgi:hypothetical protein